MNVPDRITFVIALTALLVLLVPATSQAAASPDGIQLASLASLASSSSSMTAASTPVNKLRSRATGMSAAGALTVFGGGFMIYPLSTTIPWVTLINPVTVVIGAVMIAGGAVLLVAGGRKMARVQAMEGGSDQFLDEIPPAPAFTGLQRTGRPDMVRPLAGQPGIRF